MNTNETKFAELLLLSGLEFKPQVKIIKHHVIKAVVDFYIPKHNVYCEVISSKQALIPRISKLRKLITDGYNITFYEESGRKVLLTIEMLNRLGVESNSSLFKIPELKYGECTVSGKNYFDKRYAECYG